MYSNYDLENLVTPVDADVFEQLLRETNYNKEEIEFVINGFRNGFNIEYQGPTIRQSRSRNIPFTVGDKTILWTKLMKEVKLKRVAGPFDEIPFDNFIQSPIGLVPKSGNDQTRLIFHLSYEFEDSKGSVNANTPKELCSVQYNDLDKVVQSILIIREQELKRRSKDGYNDTETDYVIVFLSKTDLKSAFRILPLSRNSWP